MPIVVRASRRVTVTGVVQGVGFRPFVHRLAVRHALAGAVRNVAGEVEIDLEGSAADIDAFLAALRAEAPPLARIDGVETREAAPGHHAGFVVEPSRDALGRRQPVPPDAATCAACEAELFTPGDRRHRYPFITCTDCGPRFTIIEALPYDRERTSMAAFTMCPACRVEYQTPGDRRFRSETNSCPACGPRLWFEGATGHCVDASSDAALRAAALLIAAGGILAVRGLGGFHLAVDATAEGAVARLRTRKHRPAKPFAVMVGSLDAARLLAEVSPDEAELLQSTARPVVLLRLREGHALADGIAPGLDTVGVLLPATPLHHLLLEAAGQPLVMTSGNLSEEPIAIENREARERLGAIADGFLLHDREIVSRYDDSVQRMAGDAPVFLRRARGHAPLPLPLPIPAPVPILAVGADLKNTFTLAEGSRAYVSQHIGDLEGYETQEHWHAALHRFERLFGIRPAAIVRDMHPGYHATRLAEELGGLPISTVQHHHAHVAAVLAEHGETGPAIGVAYDGTGLGDDGQVWGAEFLLADLTGYQRLGQLRYWPLPGGDLAARLPWRSALGALSLEPDRAAAFALAFEGVPEPERQVAEAQIERGLHCPLASSMGRLFDAAAAVLGLRRESRYEGHAAMVLEAAAGRLPGRPLPFPVLSRDDARIVLDPLPLLAALGEARQSGRDVRQLAADFHASVAAATTEAVARIRSHTGCATVVLGGGVFQNARLMASLPERLRGHGFRVLLPRRLGPNDGAISYGQAAVLAARLAARHQERA